MSMDAADIAAALARGDVEIHYQPIVVLPSRQVIGLEALARLRDAEGTLRFPADFIPVAEESGLIIDLGHEVLRRAVARASRWRKDTGPLMTATVSVNVSPTQLEADGFVERVAEVLREHELPGTVLILEITESTAATTAVRPVIERLSGLGIRVAIDDFGTGFATLDTLRRFPVQMLKLDRSFVAGVTREGADRAIVRVVVELADSLGLSVVAEGIETEEQAAAVLRLGCAAMQGYLFARPGPDPKVAAASVAARVSSAIPVAGEGRDLWPLDLEDAVLAAARLLSVTDSAHRGAVHAVATSLARAAAVDERTVRAVGRLALIHDVRRLLVDGALPAGLATEPRVCALLDPGPATGETALVRAAVGAVDRAHAADPAPGPVALAGALLAEAEAGVAPVDAAWLRAVAAAVPDVVPLTELIEDLDRRRMGRRGMEERMRSVFGITRVLSTSRDTRELMRVALEEVRRIVGAASASVERWERDTNLIRCLVSVGTLGPDEVTFPQDEVYALEDFTAARRVMLTGLPYIHSLDDEVVDDEAIALLNSLAKFSSASVPIYVDTRIWGQLWFATDYGEPPFTSRDTEALLAVATLMGGVVVQAENLQRVDRMAFEDALTHLGNRRAVDDALERACARAEPVTVALLDMDRLKEINDIQGHASGDAAIRAVADILVERLSSWPRSTIGRLGGDEFCVVLPDCQAQEAREMVGAALRQLTQSGGPSVSMGLASAGPSAWEARDLLAVADEDLYRAKRLAHAAADRDERRRDAAGAYRPRRASSR